MSVFVSGLLSSDVWLNPKSRNSVLKKPKTFKEFAGKCLCSCFSSKYNADFCISDLKKIKKKKAKVRRRSQSQRKNPSGLSKYYYISDYKQAYLSKAKQFQRQGRPTNSSVSRYFIGVGPAANLNSTITSMSM